MTPDHKKALEKNLEKAAAKPPPKQSSEDEKKFDRALADSFPASDPPEQTGGHSSVKRDDAATDKMANQPSKATKH